MKTLLLLIAFALVGSDHLYSQRSTYNLDCTGIVDCSRYQLALDNADLSHLRLADSRVSYNFYKGPLIELLSGAELLELGIPVNLALLPNHRPDVILGLHEDGKIITKQIGIK